MVGTKIEKYKYPGVEVIYTTITTRSLRTFNVILILHRSLNEIHIRLCIVRDLHIISAVKEKTKVTPFMHAG